MLLLIDWTVNRMYLTLSVVIWYPLLAYFMIGAYTNIIQVEMTNLPTIKEFEVFDVEPRFLVYVLPLIVCLSIYLVTRVKFSFLEEGDLVAARFWEMVDAVEQTMQSHEQSSNVRGPRTRLMNVKFNDSDDVAIPKHIQSDSAASLFDFTDSS